MPRDTGIADRLRAAGLQVSEVSGWRTRGSTGFHPRGVVTHHTAGSSRGNAPSLNVCVHGRRDLPGPLCHVMVARDNTCFVIAAGTANHAGRGGWRGLSGNSSVYGVEVENVGTAAESWRPDQVDTMARVAAALAGGHISADMCCLHKEWAPGRKPDPHSIDGGDHRRRVAAILNRPSTPTTPPKDTTTGVPEMFLAVDGYGLFAVINGVPIVFGGPTALADMGKARAKSDGIPMMWLPKAQGERMVTELLRKHAA